MRAYMDQPVNMALHPQVKGDIAVAWHPRQIVILGVPMFGRATLGLQRDKDVAPFHDRQGDGIVCRVGIILGTSPRLEQVRAQ